MTKVNRIPFNTLPDEWAFDPRIGPFVRDILDTTFQLRERTGGDNDFGEDYVLLDGTRPMTGDFDSGGNSLTNVNLVDGRDVSVDGAKLDTVESGATADQTDAEIKTAYENNADTNAFTNSEQTKLSGIETGATADQTNAEILTAWESETSIDADDIIERDGSVAFTGPPRLPSYTVAGVPTASPAGQIIYVSNETGGAVLAFSDGTNWRRSTDRAIVS